VHLDEENGGGGGTGSEGERATERAGSASEDWGSRGARRNDASASGVSWAASRRSTWGESDGGQRGSWDAGGHGDDGDARSS